MRFSRTAQLALWDLSGHAFRSFMTGLGVMFGVGAVVAMMAVSEGASIEERRRIEAQGIDNITIRSVKPTEGAADQEGSRSTALEYGVTARDIRHIGRTFENVDFLAPVRDTRFTVYAHGKATDMRVFGVTPQFLSLSNSDMSEGRFITPLDADRLAPVCVVGRTAARHLFRFNAPLGQTVTVGNAAFKVVGVLYNPHESRMLGNRNLNDQIYIPYSTAMSLFSTTARVRSAAGRENTKVEADWLYIRVRDREQIENTRARLESYLAMAHDARDYEIVVPYAELKQLRAAEATSKIVLASIAAIALLVGGIGIMNIMMANVYERIREIGTRRAIGAKKRDILLQFLLQAVLLTSLGGLIGITIGLGIAGGISRFAGMETQVTAMSVVLSFGVSVLVGVVFGTYPAWKAANLDPITALRTE